MAKLLLFLLPAILGLLVPRSAVAVGTNYLLSGQTLDTEGHLRNGDLDLVMQGDCNLVLYNGNWQSNTANKGRNCKLTLTYYGELVINNGDGSSVWRSGDPSIKGNYTAVLHPAEGKLVVFGPSVFKIDPWVPHQLNSLRFRNIPFTKTNNLLFSGQVVYGDGWLTTENFQFVMQLDCNLVLYGGTYGWQSNTHGNGENCFLRLNHEGELIIKDGDNNKIIWSSHSSSELGKYVLILRDDGLVVIYGPAIWETRSPVKEKMIIGMVTAGKL
ncbi:hypothetical protein Taro_024537 [Colocasia esculenta]|uniref:Bulb-type lectin domain-containing protein n=1 Tax=Colocasia esculenta TaxID=4460 RepID=A0A843VKN0_COLES|nr:hypothetical protein [Colocasia esculenta]